MKIYFEQKFEAIIKIHEITNIEYNEIKNHIKKSIEKDYKCNADYISSGILVTPLHIKVKYDDLEKYMTEGIDALKKDLSATKLYQELDGTPLFKLEE